MLNIINLIGIFVLLHEPIYLLYISVAHHIRSEFPFYIGDLLWVLKIPVDAPFYPGGTITHIIVFLFFLAVGIGIIRRRQWSIVAFFSGIVIIGFGKLLLIGLNILFSNNSNNSYILEEIAFFIIFYGLTVFGLTRPLIKTKFK